MTLQAQLLNGSIRKRLVLSAAIWLSLAVLAAGGVLVYLFRAHETNELKQYLKDVQIELRSLVDADDAGALFLIGHPANPRTNKPLSGWYWQISDSENNIIAKSLSLWTHALPPALVNPEGQGAFLFVTGPDGQQLRILSDSFVTSGSSEVFTIQVAGPASLIDQNVAQYGYVVAGVLVTLVLFLLITSALQIGYVLRPINLVRNELKDIAEGNKRALSLNAPDELKPLIGEFNTLIQRNANLLERARVQVGNLAHALKTPLSVIRLELQNSSAFTPATISKNVDEMDRHIARYLSHARAAGANGLVGLRVPVGDVVNSVLRALRPTLETRGIAVTSKIPDDIALRGDRADLEELLGNVIENASKWAKTKIEISGRKSEKHLVLVIEDDGPGITPEQRAIALERGKRLDSATPGTGLGLSIVNDLVNLYEGALDLHRSDLGGLRVQLVLPSAQ